MSNARKVTTTEDLENLCHSILAEVRDISQRVGVLEAKAEPHHAFIQPKAKAKTKAKAKVVAKVSSPARQDWVNFKVLAKASGWTQEFYLALEAWKKAHKLPKKLQGEDYFVAYCAAFRAKYVVA